VLQSGEKVSDAAINAQGSYVLIILIERWSSLGPSSLRTTVMLLTLKTTERRGMHATLAQEVTRAPTTKSQLVLSSSGSSFRYNQVTCQRNDLVPDRMSHRETGAEAKVVPAFRTVHATSAKPLA